MRNYRNNLIIFLLSLILLQTYNLWGESYRVVRGDTLYSIALKYSVSVKELMSLNNIENPSALSVGMDLIIPGTEPSGIASSGTYTVVGGDTYYSISRKHGMSVSELLALNHLTSSDILSIGQTLAVSGSSSRENSPVTPVPVTPEREGVTEKRDEDRKVLPVTAGPSLVLGRTGKDASRPEWPVTGPLYSVGGDFEGVMIESVPSTYVEAVSGGEVVWAGPYWEFGQIALIESEGYIYFYGGNSDIFVNVGQKITVGTRIGRLENIDGKGNLYFTVFKEGKVIDLAMAGN